MKHSAHEEFIEFGEVKPPSDRSFGLTVGAILFAIGTARWYFKPVMPIDAMLTLPLGATLVFLAMISPALLSAPNRLWMKLGHLLSLIMNPVIMGLMFFVIFLPVALLFKFIRRDALHMRQNQEDRTYWIKRDPPGPKPETMENQF
jgi:hypothetical protein